MTADPKTCRACGSALSVTMADWDCSPRRKRCLPRSNDEQEKRYPLRAKVCEACKLVQLDYDVAPQELFPNYVYFSSYSDQWLAHARSIAGWRAGDSGSARSLVVELASNDGYLLQHYARAGVPVLGIDPPDTVAAAAEKTACPPWPNFSARAGRSWRPGAGGGRGPRQQRARPHPGPERLRRRDRRLLKPSGMATIEFPYLPSWSSSSSSTRSTTSILLYSLLCFDRCSAATASAFDVEELPTHGGSLRVFASHARGPICATAPVWATAGAGNGGEARRLDAYLRFAERVEACRRLCPRLPRRVKREGETVGGLWRRRQGEYAAQLLRGDAGRYRNGGRPQSSQAVEIPARHAYPDRGSRAADGGQAGLRADPAVESEGGDHPAARRIRSWGGRFVTPMPAMAIHP